MSSNCILVSSKCYVREEPNESLYQAIEVPHLKLITQAPQEMGCRIFKLTLIGVGFIYCTSREKLASRLAAFLPTWLRI